MCISTNSLIWQDNNWYVKWVFVGIDIGRPEDVLAVTNSLSSSSNLVNNGWKPNWTPSLSPLTSSGDLLLWKARTLNCRFYGQNSGPIYGKRIWRRSDGTSTLMRKCRLHYQMPSSSIIVGLFVCLFFVFKCPIRENRSRVLYRWEAHLVSMGASASQRA